MNCMKKNDSTVNRKNIWFYFFGICFFLDGISSTVTCFLSSYDIAYMGITGLFKITAVMELLIAIIYLLSIERKIVMFKLSYILLFFCAWGMIVGLVYHNFNSKYLVHIFTYTMPIIVMAFAYYFIKEYRQNAMLRRFYYFVMGAGLVVYIAGVVLFLVLNSMGRMRYGALGATWGMYITPFFLTSESVGQILIGYVSIAFSALSGKRSVLVGVVIAWIGSIILIRKKSKPFVTHLVMILIASVATIYLVTQTNVFSRILTTINEIFSANGNWYVATSGRNYEIELIAEYINKQPSMWITGIGFGCKVWIQDLYRHYCHFSPLGYVMTGGIFASVSIYTCLCWNTIKGFVLGLKGALSEEEKPFIIQLGNAIIISLLGASLTATPMWWFFIGGAFAIIEDKERKKYVHRD